MIHVFEELTDEQAGRLIKHIFEYVNDKNPELNDQILKVSFAPIKAQLKRDLEDWLKICQRNKGNGNLGGRPKKNQEDTNETERITEEPKKPSGFKSNPKNPSKPDNDNDNDNDREKIETHNNVLLKLLNNQMWMEALAMNFKKDIEEVRKHFNKFRLDCILEGKYKTDENDAKSHFKHWVKFNPFPEPQGYVYKRPDLSSLERNPF